MNLEELKNSIGHMHFLEMMTAEGINAIAAEIHGWVDTQMDGYWSIQTKPSPEMAGFVTEQWSHLHKLEWDPYNDLNQAYAFLDYCCGRYGLVHSRVQDVEHTYHNLGKPGDGDTEIMLLEELLGAHAGAVTVIAILGYLRWEKAKESEEKKMP